MRATIAILILAAVGIAVAQGPYPIPALERFPDRPYIPPPTPEEVAFGEAQAASNEIAETEFVLAASNVLTSIEVAWPTTWQEKRKAAETLTLHAKAIKKIKADAALPSTASSNAVTVYRHATNTVDKEEHDK